MPGGPRTITTPPWPSRASSSAARSAPSSASRSSSESSVAALIVGVSGALRPKCRDAFGDCPDASGGARPEHRAHSDETEERMKRLVLAAAAAGAVMALVPAAEAAPEKARFRASISGTQTLDWTTPVKTQVECGGDWKGRGHESFDFRSSRPEVVTAAATRDGGVVFRQRRELPAARDTGGSVTRHGTLELIPHERPMIPCGDGGPGEPLQPPAPDCGTKRFAHLPIEIWPAGNDRIQIDVGDPAPPSPFQNCPDGAIAFPNLLGSAGSGSPRYSTRLPRAELFDRSIGKEIVVGRGHWRTRGLGRTVDMRLRWVLTLERVR